MEAELVTHALLASAALAAGAVNSIAGGGTILTFPSLMSVMPEVPANMTSTISLVPGSIAGTWAFQKEFRAARHWVLFLLVPSLAGGLAGSYLLFFLDPRYFKVLVPWLILTATLLLASQPFLGRRRRPDTELTPPLPATLSGRVLLLVFQFLIAVYGGYFGAGIGILMIASLGAMGLNNIHQMNGVKNFLATCINAISVLLFIYSGQIRWEYVPTMAASSILGGYLAARYARRLPAARVRVVVVGIGFTLAAIYFYKQFHAVPSTPVNPPASTNPASQADDEGRQSPG